MVEKVSMNKTTWQSICQSVRAKLGVSTLYKANEVANAIDSIVVDSSGGEDDVTPTPTPTQSSKSVVINFSDHCASGNWNGTGTSANGRYHITPLHPIFCDAGDKIKVTMPNVSIESLWNIKIWFLKNTLSFGTTSSIVNYIIGDVSDYVYEKYSTNNPNIEFVVPEGAIAFQINIGIRDIGNTIDELIFTTSARTRTNTLTLNKDWFGYGVSGANQKNVKFKFDWIQ